MIQEWPVDYDKRLSSWLGRLDFVNDRKQESNDSINDDSQRIKNR